MIATVPAVTSRVCLTRPPRPNVHPSVSHTLDGWAGAATGLYATFSPESGVAAPS
jgi:hypothetical protein